MYVSTYACMYVWQTKSILHVYTMLASGLKIMKYSYVCSYTFTNTINLRKISTAKLEYT